MDYLFYNFYNLYYKDGNHKVTDNPSLRAVNTFTLFFLLWILFFSGLYNYYVNNIKRLLSLEIYLVIYIALLIPIYYIYITKQRYQLVYEKYSHLSTEKRRKGTIICVILFFFPMILIILFGVLNK